MPVVEFEPAIPANEGPQTLALSCAATAARSSSQYPKEILIFLSQILSC